MLCKYKCVQVKNKQCLEHAVILRLISWIHSHGSKTSTLTVHEMCRNPPFPPPRAHKQVHITLDKQWRGTSHVLWDYLQAEFHSSENSARILRISGYWHFFRLAKFHLYKFLQTMRNAATFSAQALTHRCRTALDKKCLDTFYIIYCTSGIFFQL